MNTALNSHAEAAQNPLPLAAGDASLQQQAVEKAIRFLVAAGATYTVTLPGREQPWTNCPAAPAKKARVQVNDWIAVTDYITKIEALKPGDVLRFTRNDFPEFAGLGWNSFAASFHSRVKARFEPDTYILENRDGVIQVLRV